MVIWMISISKKTLEDMLKTYKDRQEYKTQDGSRLDETREETMGSCITASDVSGAGSCGTPDAMMCTKHSHRRSPDVSVDAADRCTGLVF